MTLEGRVLNGIIVLNSPTALPEGACVRVEVLTAEPQAPSLFDRLGDLAGKAIDLPADASTQHDHYLYGAPKTS